ncbi:MAG: TIGR04438 family Trp-rich protein [Proteobacteria bacterium]|uniref:TIGR04438 family Trp-rich protein n=1 Tax=Aquabacterium sp. TaxID=1872578 RepID=UPI0035C7467B|nr:TIGR04438 family Trp-rich protein [Pseudomonadota bacterium]
MWLVAVGVLVLVLNFAGVGAVGRLEWWGDAWILLMPFGLAALWWFIADTSGHTQRKAMAKMDARKEERRLKSLEALGMRKPGQKPGRRR